MKREINKIEICFYWKVVEQHKPHLKQVNSSAGNYEVRYAPHADLLLPVHKNKLNHNLQKTESRKEQK